MKDQKNKQLIKSLVKQWSVRAAVGTLFVASAVGYQNCSGNMQTEGTASTSALSSTSGGSSTTTGSGSTSTNSGSNPYGKFGSQALQIVQPAAPAAANLGTSFTVPVTIQSTGTVAYSGMVNLSVAIPELGLVDTGRGITFSISPASVFVSNSTPGTATVTVNVTTMAPSFNASMFHIVATDSVDSTLVATVPVPLTVKAVYNVNVTGKAAPEAWSMPVGGSVSFIPHTGGLVVNFNNTDMANTHIVHSTNGGSGPIMHQPTGSPMPVSKDGVSAGGTYTQTVAASTTMSNAQVWEHNLETATQARTMIFNAPAPNPSPTPSPTPGPTPVGATFSNINTTILQVSCVGCHASATASNGEYSVANYASVVADVKPSNASLSVLYNEVAGGAMPVGGPALTSTQLAEIAAWINAGAPNN